MLPYTMRASLLSRIPGLIGMLAAAGLGLGSRLPWIHDLPVIGPYGGDAAWTMAACAGIRTLAPSMPILRVTVLGYLASVAVECSQLVQADWLNAIREHPIGALLIGRGFLWSDLAAYAGGAVVFALIFTPIDRLEVRGGNRGKTEKRA
jgi:hypothetical protein